MSPSACLLIAGGPPNNSASAKARSTTTSGGWRISGGFSTATRSARSTSRWSTASVTSVAAKRGKPLTETVTDRRGRTYERRRRALSNTSINAMIGLLGQILQQAVDYDLIARNPVRVGGGSSRFLPRAKTSRTFLEIDEFHALLDAAGALDVGDSDYYKGIGRRAMVAALGLGGFRIRDLLDLRLCHVDLAR